MNSIWASSRESLEIVSYTNGCVKSKSNAIQVSKCFNSNEKTEAWPKTLSEPDPPFYYTSDTVLEELFLSTVMELIFKD